MPKRAVTSIYISCWSLRDPLCQTQSLAYLEMLAVEGNRFALITFEQSKYALHGAEKARARKELADRGIYWYPLPRLKRSPLFARAFECAGGVLMGAYLARRYHPRIVHSRSTVPAAMAMALSKLYGLAFLYDADCELSREYVDMGYWRSGSLSHKLTARCERLARRLSDSTVVLSEHTRRSFLQEGRSSAPITVVPCCVDVDRFRFDPAERAAKRRELGVSDEPLFVYVGKIGSWYLVEETFEFFRVAVQRLGAARLLIVSPDPREGFDVIAARHHVERSRYDVRSATHGEVVGWLCAADVGLALIASVESKRGCSPVKVGEYLSVGLPVVITEGIGDCTDLIRRERLGVALEEHSQASYERGVDLLAELWREGRALGARCRAAAEAHVSLTGVGRPRYREVYRALCNGSHAQVGGQRPRSPVAFPR